MDVEGGEVDARVSLYDRTINAYGEARAAIKAALQLGQGEAAAAAGPGGCMEGRNRMCCLWCCCCCTICMLSTSCCSHKRRLITLPLCPTPLQAAPTASSCGGSWCLWTARFRGWRWRRRFRCVDLM